MKTKRDAAFGEKVESVNTDDDDDERKLNSLRQFSFSRLNIVFIKLSSYQTISDRIKSVSQTRKFAKMQPKRENKRISLFPSEALFPRKTFPVFLWRTKNLMIEWQNRTSVTPLRQK